MGNILATITDAKIYQTNGSSAKVISGTDYYAFGASMPSRSYQDAGYSKYRYGFNGKENDDDFQDYGMRIYCPECGVFLSVDPIASQYPFYSPYHFAGNSPIAAIDMDGLEPVSVKNLLNTFSRWFGIPEFFEISNAEDIEEVAALNQDINRKQANARQLKEGLEKAHEYQKQAISVSGIGAGAVVAFEVGTGQKSISEALTDQSIDQITNKVGGKVIDNVIEVGILDKFLAVFKSPKTDKTLGIEEDILNKPISEMEREALLLGNKKIYDDKIFKINNLINTTHSDIKVWDDLLDVQKTINGSLVSELETKIKVGNAQIERLEKLKDNIINQPIDWIDNELDRILKNK